VKKVKQFLKVVVLLFVLLGLLTPASLPMVAATPRIGPELIQLASEAPGEMVRVIVQKADSTNLAEILVGRFGGMALKDLPLINAFAAVLPASEAMELASNDSVQWVSLDAPVISTGKPSTKATFTLLDTFSTAAYNNNEGIASWTTDWIEGDVAGAGPTSGNVFIFDGELFLSDSANTGTEPSAARQADLSYGVTSAMLSYRFRVGPDVNASEDAVVFEVSTDGGVTYSTLSTLQFRGGTSGTAYRDIVDYVSPETRFRYRVASGFDGPNKYFALEYFQIEYEGNALPPTTHLDTMNVREVWDMGYTGAGIGVAVIDSGITQDRDFTSLQRMSFNPNSTSVNDVYGHGTHVAGIIAANGTDSDGHYLGVAPDVNLFSLKISDETGMAYESDTVEALQWVFDNKDQYNIRVVNLSVQSTVMMPYHDSPLDAAAEILWFNGVVVVAASGNYFSDYTFNPVRAAPANDPFIITVGASNEKGTTRIRDDSVANFSAYGVTLEGHYKPDIYAPGKDIISVLSGSSSWDVEYPDRVVFSGQYFRISGTSMAAPMVAGAAALLLQAEPNLTPDQVKYRLVHSSESLSTLPYLNVYKALTTPTTESSNDGIIPHMLLAKMALIAYWSNTECGETCDWENVDWGAVNWDSVNWDSVAWNSVNWSSVNWNSVNWNSVNWNSVNWNSVNWNSVNWNSVNWNSVNWNSVNWNSVNWNSVSWND
jgi:serine protease AprX